VGGQCYSPTTLPHVENPIPIVQEARWTSNSVLKGAENLATTGVRKPDRPTGREL
jgi:hypothetical protein